MYSASFPSIAAVNSIAGYEGLVTTLRNGETVHAIIDVSKCKYIKGSNDWKRKPWVFVLKISTSVVAPDLVKGKKMRLIASSWHDYVGNEKHAYISRSLLRILEDGSVEVVGNHLV